MHCIVRDEVCPGVDQPADLEGGFSQPQHDAARNGCHQQLSGEYLLPVTSLSAGVGEASSSSGYPVKMIVGRMIEPSSDR